MIHLEYNSDEDELIAEVLGLPTSADHCAEDLVSVGFDGAGDHTMPTTLCLQNLRSEPNSQARSWLAKCWGTPPGNRFESWSPPGGASATWFSTKTKRTPG